MMIPSCNDNHLLLINQSKFHWNAMPFLLWNDVFDCNPLNLFNIIVMWICKVRRWFSCKTLAGLFKIH